MESDERLAALLGIDASMLALARLMAPDLSAEFVERLRNAGADAQAAEENAVSLQNAVLLCSDEATRDKTMQGLHGWRSACRAGHPARASFAPGDRQRVCVPAARAGRHER
jgi:hypothetical protein